SCVEQSISKKDVPGSVRVPGNEIGRIAPKCDVPTVSGDQTPLGARNLGPEPCLNAERVDAHPLGHLRPRAAQKRQSCKCSFEGLHRSPLPRWITTMVRETVTPRGYVAELGI